MSVSHLVIAIISILLLFLTPLDIVLPFSRSILVYESPYNLLCIIKFVKIILEYFGLFELIHEGASLTKHFVLVQELFEETSN